MDRNAADTRPQPIDQATRPSVFIVHGHHTRALNEAESLVRSIGADPIVLRDQPIHGQTIIESLETHASRAAYAMVLLTGDDSGRRGPRQVGQKVVKLHEPLLPRARQNVVFEFGYFVGRLGRSRVCVLKQPKVEIPSDISGVRYVDYAPGWENTVARELRVAFGTATTAVSSEW
jgi:predicted nucleotide-binding protein